MSLCVPPDIFLCAPSAEVLILLEHCSRGMGGTCYPRNIWRGHDNTRFVAEEDLNSEPEHERSNLSGDGLGMCFAPPKKMRSVLQDKGIKHFRLRNPIRKLKCKEEGERGRLGDRPAVSIKEGRRDVFQRSSQELAKNKK